uniref:Copine Vb n=1 Tax=Hippocampus comes TaxID=109280 RepID=A0A3Q2Y3J6_HIPCM
MNKMENMSSVYDFDPITGNIPATKVEVTVSCRSVCALLGGAKSGESLCVLYTQGVETKQWREFGRTEVIDNTLNPDFVRKYILDYFFEEKQNLLGSPASRLEKSLGGIPGKKCGTIILSAEELSNCRDSATMQFCANKLDKKDFFGKSDPFMVFYRSNEDGTFTICHKTEVVKNTLNPVWQPFTIPVRALCNGDYDRTIKVEVYDWDRDGGHDFIGDFTTSYRELARGQSQFNVYEVINTKKKMKKKKYVNSGTVTLLSFSVESEFTFLDYIKGGTQINFTVAIDFTASNGNPSQSTSLHYMNPYQLNAYAMALKAVGEIIQDYDSDKMFPALGFGAKLPPDGRVSHEFPLNGNMENPYCNGIEGILEAYHQSLKTVQLYGPTNFAPVVNHVAKNVTRTKAYAASVQDGSQYFVLLIITDGVISDMAQTKEAIVNGAKLPMSIIIVGVGQAEFDAMVELDGDDIRVSSRGKLAERDIVQFVPFRDYMDRTGNHVLSMARLAKDVLAEIPDQFISYMKSRGVKPNPAPPPYTPHGLTHHHTHI